MIRWPSERFGSRTVRDEIARFRETSAACELAEDTHEWMLETASWTEEPPVQLIWRNEEGSEKCFTREESGEWTFAPVASDLVRAKTTDPLTPLGVP
jgi:hypothetical protein